MFGFNKHKTDHPAAIAASVMNVATNPDLLSRYYEVFATSADQRKRIDLAAIAFVYCCSHWWASAKTDHVATACAGAGELIPRIFGGEIFVSIGDYVASRYELSKMMMLLETEFRQRIPIPKEAVHETEQFYAVIREYEICLPTLVKAVLLLRQKQFVETVQATLGQKDRDVTFMALASNLDEQVTGITTLDVRNDAERATEQGMRSIQGAPVLFDSFRALSAQLNTL